MTANDTTGSFLDYLLANDTNGELQAIVDRDAADLAAGKTWGVYHLEELVVTRPALYMARAAVFDDADAFDRGLDEYEIREITVKESDNA